MKMLDTRGGILPAPPAPPAPPAGYPPAEVYLKPASIYLTTALPTPPSGTNIRPQRCQGWAGTARNTPASAPAPPPARTSCSDAPASSDRENVYLELTDDTPSTPVNGDRENIYLELTGDPQLPPSTGHDPPLPLSTGHGRLQRWLIKICVAGLLLGLVAAIITSILLQPQMQDGFKNLSATGQPLALCPTEYLRSPHGHCYNFYDSAFLTWQAVRNHCATTPGAYLTEVSSKMENTFIDGLIGDQAVWLGGIRVSGEWTWSHSSGRLDEGYNLWRRGEPDGGEGNCVYMSGYSGKWMNDDCSAKWYAVCEHDGYPQTPAIRLTGM